MVEIKINEDGDPEDIHKEGVGGGVFSERVKKGKQGLPSGNRQGSEKRMLGGTLLEFINYRTLTPARRSCDSVGASGKHCTPELPRLHNCQKRCKAVKNPTRPGSEMRTADGRAH